MVWLFIIICVIAIALLHSLEGETALIFWIALGTAGVNLWSFVRILRENDPSSTSIWIVLNILTAIGGIGLLIYAIVVRVGSLLP